MVAHGTSVIHAVVRKITSVAVAQSAGTTKRKALAERPPKYSANRVAFVLHGWTVQISRAQNDLVVKVIGLVNRQTFTNPNKLPKLAR